MPLQSCSNFEPNFSRRLVSGSPIQSSSAITPGLVSVIVACCGLLEHTRLLAPSLLRYSRRPYELVFLDSGSIDGTYEFLSGLASAAPVRIEVVRTLSGVGLPAAIQEALALAHG